MFHMACIHSSRTQAALICKRFAILLPTSVGRAVEGRALVEAPGTALDKVSPLASDMGSPLALDMGWLAELGKVSLGKVLGAPLGMASQVAGKVSGALLGVASEVALRCR